MPGKGNPEANTLAINQQQTSSQLSKYLLQWQALEKWKTGDQSFPAKAKSFSRAPVGATQLQPNWLDARSFAHQGSVLRARQECCTMCPSESHNMPKSNYISCCPTCNALSRLLSSMVQSSSGFLEVRPRRKHEIYAKLLFIEFLASVAQDARRRTNNSMSESKATIGGIFATVGKEKSKSFIIYLQYLPAHATTSDIHRHDNLLLFGSETTIEDDFNRKQSNALWMRCGAPTHLHTYPSANGVVGLLKRTFINAQKTTPADGHLHLTCNMPGRWCRSRWTPFSLTKFDY